MSLILEGNKNFIGFANLTNQLDNLKIFGLGRVIDKKYLISLSKKPLS
jgi:hypothetical protein